MRPRAQRGSLEPESAGREEEAVETLADSGVLWILAFTILPVLYLLPTLVGAMRSAGV